MLKYIFYLIHVFFILLSFIFFMYWQVTLLQFLVILSWRFNDNQCILTQLEYYYFGETLIDYIYLSRNSSSFRVPWYHRYLLYLFFLFGLIQKIE